MRSVNRLSAIGLILLSILFLISTVYSRPEVCGYIEKVVDGDTIWISIEDVLEDRYGNFSGDSFKVRLADINAPEISSPDGLMSRDALVQLIGRYGNFACLDIDDNKIYDKYGRIVAVLYLNYNESHMINVNKYLVENGYAEYIDYENEFNPQEFMLFISKDSDISEDSIPDIYILILLAIVVVIYIAKRRNIRL